MHHAQGLRTHPTIKPLVKMNRKSLRKWEIRLGLPHLVILVGIVTGSMAGAFFLAYGSGLKEGFTRARESSLSHVARIPVAQEQFGAEVSDELVSEVYAKLGNAEAHSNSHTDNSLELGEQAELPELGVIESVEHTVPPTHLKEVTGAGNADGDAQHQNSQKDAHENAGHLSKKRQKHSDASSHQKTHVEAAAHEGHSPAEDGSIHSALDSKKPEEAVEDHNSINQLASAAGVRVLGDESNSVHHDDLSVQQHLSGTKTKSEEVRKAHRSEKTLGSLLKARQKQPELSQQKALDHSVSRTSQDTTIKPSLFDDSSHSTTSSSQRTAVGTTQAPVNKAVTPALPKVGVVQPGNVLARRSGTTVATQPAKLGRSSASSDGLIGNVSAGWYAQVAAPSKASDAKSLAGRLRSSGFPVRIEQAKVRGQEYFRVLVGPEKTRTYAERLVTQLKREPYVQGAPFVKKVR